MYEKIRGSCISKGDGVGVKATGKTNFKKILYCSLLCFGVILFYSVMCCGMLRVNYVTI